jgi:acid stress-induced BolA-like protein IbaG/YrbA
MHAEQIQSIILQAFPESQVVVQSDDQVHFSARVVSDAFVGKTRLQRHRMVHAALTAEVGDALGREIHALTLDLKTPQELT